MDPYIQVVGTSEHGAGCFPSCLLVHPNHNRVLINCGDGIQRFASEHRLRLSKLTDIVITALTPQNLGGLPGLLLTLEAAPIVAPKVTKSHDLDAEVLLSVDQSYEENDIVQSGGTKAVFHASSEWMEVRTDEGIPQAIFFRPLVKDAREIREAHVTENPLLPDAVSLTSSASSSDANSESREKRKCAAVKVADNEPEWQVGWRLRQLRLKHFRTIRIWGPGGLSAYMKAITRRFARLSQLDIEVREVRPEQKLLSLDLHEAGFDYVHVVTGSGGPPPCGEEPLNKKRKVVLSQDSGFPVEAEPSRKSSSITLIVGSGPAQSGKFLVEKAKVLGIAPGPSYGKLKNGMSVILSDGRVILPSQVCEQSTAGVPFAILPCANDAEAESLISVLANCPDFGCSQTSGEVSVSPPPAAYLVWLHRISRSTMKSVEEALRGSFTLFASSQRIVQVVLDGLAMGYALHPYSSMAAFTSMLHNLCPSLFQVTGWHDDKRLGDGGVTADTMSRVPPRLRIMKSAESEGQNNAQNFSDADKSEHTTSSPDGNLHAAPLTRLHLTKKRIFDGSRLPNRDPRTSEPSECSLETLFEFRSKSFLTCDGTEGLKAKCQARYQDYQQKLKELGIASILPCIDTLGTGAAIPSKYRNVSSTMLSVRSNLRLLFDCGEGTVSQIRNLCSNELDFEAVLLSIRVIFISHAHADHHLGLPTLLALRQRASQKWSAAARRSSSSSSSPLPQTTSPVQIICPQNVKEWMNYVKTTFQLCDQMNVIFVSPKFDGSVADVPIAPLSHEVEDLSIRVQRAEVDHMWIMIRDPVSGEYRPRFNDAYAFRVTICKGGIEDFNVTFSGDTRPTERLIELAKDTDVFICEGTFEDDLHEEAVKRKHCTHTEAYEMAKAARVRCLLLTHFSQRYPKSVKFKGESTNNSRVPQCTLVAYDMMRIPVEATRGPEQLPQMLTEVCEHLQDVIAGSKKTLADMD